MKAHQDPSLTPFVKDKGKLVGLEERSYNELNNVLVKFHVLRNATMYVLIPALGVVAREEAPEGGEATAPCRGTLYSLRWG